MEAGVLEAKQFLCDREGDGREKRTGQGRGGLRVRS